MEPKLLRIREVTERTGISRASVYRLMGKGTFPQPLRPTEKMVRWRVEEVEAWLDNLTQGESLQR